MIYFFISFSLFRRGEYLHFIGIDQIGGFIGNIQSIFLAVLLQSQKKIIILKFFQQGRVSTGLRNFLWGRSVDDHQAVVASLGRLYKVVLDITEENGLDNVGVDVKLVYP